MIFDNVAFHGALLIFSFIHILRDFFQACISVAIWKKSYHNRYGIWVHTTRSKYLKCNIIYGVSSRPFRNTFLQTGNQQTIFGTKNELKGLNKQKSNVQTKNKSSRFLGSKTVK